MLNVLGWAHFAAGDYAKGAEYAQRSVGEAPNLPASRQCLMLNWIGLGEFARATAEFQVLREMAPQLLDERISGRWLFSHPELVRRATTFFRIAADLEDPSAADALR